ncbi:hypothetical protein T02_10489 [Trichinella nativa]|uniref:Uncharacterized protein n=1 Tax=Trichinella nativa TaxID=6335 RepID=A0A0V1L5W2_9BILA|nr:hypothetical protein T02_10489 [Trichinella nativa]
MENLHIKFEIVFPGMRSVKLILSLNLRKIHQMRNSMDDKFVDVVVFECELLHPATTNGQGPVFWFPFEPIKSRAR